MRVRSLRNTYRIFFFILVWYKIDHFSCWINISKNNSNSVVYVLHKITTYIINTTLKEEFFTVCHWPKIFYFSHKHYHEISLVQAITPASFHSHPSATTARHQQSEPQDWKRFKGVTTKCKIWTLFRFQLQQTNVKKDVFK